MKNGRTDKPMDSASSGDASLHLKNIRETWELNGKGEKAEPNICCEEGIGERIYL